MVEKAEGEGSTGAMEGGWEPPSVEKLSPAVAVTVGFAEAVGNPHSMYAGNVDQH